jgi:hypothetical protein
VQGQQSFVEYRGFDRVDTTIEKYSMVGSEDLLLCQRCISKRRGVLGAIALSGVAGVVAGAVLGQSWLGSQLYGLLLLGFPIASTAIVVLALFGGDGVAARLAKVTAKKHLSEAGERPALYFGQEVGTVRVFDVSEYGRLQ